MMDFFRKILGKDKLSPFYSKLSKAIDRSDLQIDVEQAFYLGGFKYDEEIYQSLIEALNGRNFDKTFLKLNYDAQSDNIELYFVKDTEGNGHLVVMFDPVELYQPEEVLNVFSFDEKALNIDEKKLIFSK